MEEPLIKRQFSAGVSGKRLSGRPPIAQSNSSRSSFLSQSSLDNLDLNGLQAPSAVPIPDGTGSQDDPQRQGSHLQHATQKVDRASERLLAQVAEWLQHEKSKRESKKPRRHHLRRKHRTQPHEETVTEETAPQPEAEEGAALHRTASIDSNSSDVSLHRLERIIQDGMAALGLNNIPQYNSKIGRRPSHRSKKYGSRSSIQLSRAASSDTDYLDGDVLVPSCDAILDNTKTLKYSQGNAEDSNSISSKRMEKEERAWTTFKNEIIRLAHTLRLKGWRRVALDSGDEISVERLSGALTNAVYVVTPPENLPDSEHITKKKPPKLLLRIYGPNVENLIDRDIELAILKRLARKRIGPRLLGTFTNGRFEQYFNAEPLTPELLRDPATSKQIAKRMRELHNGVDLLKEERDDGPTVFKNWDCWVGNVEKRTLFLDQQVAAYNSATTVGPRDSWKKGGFVCGTEWAKFKAIVDRYREFLVEWYGGPKVLREKLVFAHNDVSGFLPAFFNYSTHIRYRHNTATSSVFALTTSGRRSCNPKTNTNSLLSSTLSTPRPIYPDSNLPITSPNGPTTTTTQQPLTLAAPSVATPHPRNNTASSKPTSITDPSFPALPPPRVPPPTRTPHPQQPPR